VNPVIRPIEPNDITAVQSLYRAAALAVPENIYVQSIRKEWASRTDEEFIKQSSFRQRFVAEIENQILGYVGYASQRSTLTECYVHPRHHGIGLGQHLVNYVFGLAKADRLERLTVLASINAIPFYKKMGFAIDHPENLQMGDGQILPCCRMSILLAPEEG
jgi:putative acetyltransferase